MCRFFAYLSPTEPCFLYDVLIAPANAISKQCSEHYLPRLLPHGQETRLDNASDRLLRLRNSLLNMDGLGIAWYTNTAAEYLNIRGPRPALYKSQSPPTNDLNFKNICSNTETFCLFAHIRASSGSVVTPVNCHPFVFGQYTFMHNGVVADFTRIRREMANQMSHDAYANVLGSTDSEHAAALYINRLTDGGSKDSWEKEYSLAQLYDAMAAVIKQIIQIQRTILGDSAQPNSLNFCVTDGKKMVATRFRNHASEQPPSLYWSETAGRKLNHKYPEHPDSALKVNEQAVKARNESIGKHVIIASEPTTYDEKEWHLIPRNHALTVDEHGIAAEVSLAYDSSLDAVDAGGH